MQESPECTKVVCVVAYPLDDRDADRFGLVALRELGIPTEVWDVSHFFFSQLEHVNVQVPKWVDVHKFNELKSWRSACGRLTATDAVLIAGLRLRNLHLTQWLLIRQLLTSPARVCTFTSGSLPAFVPPPSQPEKEAAKPWASLRVVGLKAKARLASSYRRAVSGLWMDFLARPPRGLDLICAGVDLAPVPNSLISQSTRIQFIHVFDYDLFLKFAHLTPQGEVPLLFVDSMGPSHPDYLALDIPQNLSMAAYSEVVKAALDAIEQQTHKRVEIAAHPRATSGSMEQWYGNRKVHYGRTAELIPQADVVILAEGSTAIGLAVAHRRPVVLLDSVRFDEFTRTLMHSFAAALNLTPLLVDSGSFDFEPAPISELSYALYMESLVKRAGTPEAQFWEVAIPLMVQ